MKASQTAGRLDAQRSESGGGEGVGRLFIVCAWPRIAQQAAAAANGASNPSANGSQQAHTSHILAALPTLQYAPGTSWVSTLPGVSQCTNPIS